MEARDKKILINAVSIVLIVVVLANVYRGITVSKVGIPGLLEIEFNSGEDPPAQPAELPTVEQDSQHVNEREDVVRPQSQDLSNPGSTGTELRTTSGPALISLNGFWSGDDGSTYEFFQTGSSITFTEYGMFGATASGYGSVANSTITLEYETIFGTYGIATLSVSANGQNLTGRADDHTSGTTTFLNLTRQP